MAKKPVAGNERRDVVFLQCDLDKATKAALIEWVSEEHNYFDFIEKCVDSSMKFSCGYDTYNTCFMASLSRQVTVEGKSLTYVLVGRGGDLLQAIQAVMYKHYVMLEEKWDDLGRKNAKKETDWS